MRGRIAQRAQRVQVHQRPAAHIGLEILRLIHDDDRVDRTDVFNWRKGPLALLVDLVVVFGKAVNVDHQHAQRIALGKVAQLGQLGAVVCLLSSAFGFG